MNECTKCTDGLIEICVEGKLIKVTCDWCGGYSDHEDIAK